MNDDFDDDFDQYERNEQLGLVHCDINCAAKEFPETLEEYKAAWLHWRSHSYIHGCSHGH